MEYSKPYLLLVHHNKHVIKNIYKSDLTYWNRFPPLHVELHVSLNDIEENSGKLIWEGIGDIMQPGRFSVHLTYSHKSGILILVLQKCLALALQMAVHVVLATE